nr:hypothetical protein [Francisella tularensis]
MVLMRKDGFNSTVYIDTLKDCTFLNVYEFKYYRFNYIMLFSKKV